MFEIIENLLPAICPCFVASKDAPRSPNAIDTSWLKVGCYSQTGIAHKNEDRFLVINNLREENENLFSFVGVYDGHGGGFTVDLVKGNLHEEIVRTKAFSEGLFKEAIAEGFVELDKKILERAVAEKNNSGSCAVIALVAKDLANQRKMIYIANVGDCRAVLIRQNEALQLSMDHKAQLEKSRILQSGGSVINGRLFGMLAVSRAFGDIQFKFGKVSNILTADPFIAERELDANDLFVLMASDGFWDVISNEETPTLIQKGTTKTNSLAGIAQYLVNEAALRGSRDDITLAIISLQ